MDPLDALIETFTWVGLGGGLLFILIGGIIRLADGRWEPTHVVLEDSPEGRVAHWFDAAGGVGSAALTADQERTLAGRDEADAFTRAGVLDRIRLGRGAPAVRTFTLLGFALLGIGAVAAVISLVRLFTAG